MKPHNDQDNRVLLAGSSFSAVPLLEALKTAGMSVTVCGNLKDDPCHALADQSLYFDYSSKDDLLCAAREGDYKYIVPSCNDAAYLACTYAANALGLPGYDSDETCDLLHTKSLFRDYMQAGHYAVPRASSDGSGLTYPVLVKPVDSSGGKGMTRVDRPADLPAATRKAKAASGSGRVVVEEYFSGTLHSHSVFLKYTKIVREFFVDEFCVAYPYAVDCSNHPSRLADDIRRAMHDQMERMATALNLTDGLLHTQFMTNGQDIRIIECMRRCPGDLYGRLIEYSAGFDYAAHVVAPYINRAYPAIQNNPVIPMGRHTVASDVAMTAGDVAFDFAPDHMRFVRIKDHGAQLDPAPHDKLGLMFVAYDNEKDMLQKTEKLGQYVTIHEAKEVSLCARN